MTALKGFEYLKQTNKNSKLRVYKEEDKFLAQISDSSIFDTKFQLYRLRHKFLEYTTNPEVRDFMESIQRLTLNQTGKLFSNVPYCYPSLLK